MLDADNIINEIKEKKEDAVSTYFRNEIKYLCAQEQLIRLKQRILGCGCRADSHAGADGTYVIRSVYFDDYSDSCYWENINGDNPREKYRIRIYDGAKSIIKLECKRKEGSKIHKDSCTITEEECMAFLGGKVPLRDSQSPLFNKFSMLVSGRGFRSKVIVEYERAAFVYPVGNVRITFDRYISSSTQFDCFLKKNIRKRPVMPLNRHILEVKFDELLPDFIYNSLQLSGLQRTAYSKYAICRKFDL